MRLGKYLALAGVASRRHSEDLIRAGEVRVNGRTVTDPAHAVSDQDQILHAGRRLQLPDSQDLVYLMLNKPLGVVSSMASGREGGPTLNDLVTVPQQVHPVGRLDRDTSGLILLTSDGDLTLRLAHPRYEIEKEYLVKLDRPLHPRQVEKIGRGVKVDDIRVDVRGLESAAGGKYRIVIHEGRNRIVRRLFGELGCNVVELRRLRVGPISLGRLAIGKWRKLTDSEIDRLREAVGVQRPAD